MPLKTPLRVEWEYTTWEETLALSSSLIFDLEVGDATVELRITHRRDETGWFEVEGEFITNPKNVFLFLWAVVY